MLDIADIVDRVRREQGWRKATAARHAADYIAFLASPPCGAAPSPAVDAIWHAHILHTRRYRADCAALVGRFVDHEPDPVRAGQCTQPHLPPEDAGRDRLARCVMPEEPPEDPSQLHGARCVMPVDEPPKTHIRASRAATRGATPHPLPRPTPAPLDRRGAAALAGNARQPEG